MPLTYLTYVISGLHAGLWLQSWEWTWVTMWCFHVFVWAVGAGRGDAGALDYWLGRPLAGMLAGSIGYLYYRLLGSPCAGWCVRVWADEDSLRVYRSTNWRDKLAAVFASWWSRGVKGQAPPSHALHVTDTDMWPLVGRVSLDGVGGGGGGNGGDASLATTPPRRGVDINRDYTRVRLDDAGADVLPVLAFHDEQPPSAYGRNHYLLSFTAGHQLLWNLAFLHTLVLSGLLVVWERLPTLAEGRPATGMAVLWAGYVLATLGVSAIVRTPASRMWPNAWRRFFFWAGWVALASVVLGLGCGLGLIHDLHERWTGGLIPLGAALVPGLPGLFWIFTALTHAYCGDKVLRSDGTGGGAYAIAHTEDGRPRRKQRLDGTLPHVPIRDVLRPCILVYK